MQPLLRWKAISIALSDCVLVTLLIQHATPMCHTVICGLYGSTAFFSHYSINGTLYEKKLFNKKCVFWFVLQLLSEIFRILKRIERDMMINVQWSSRKVPVFLDIFQWLLCFLARLPKNIQISYFIKIGSVGNEMFHADGQTDMTKRIVVFRKLRTRLKMY